MAQPRDFTRLSECDAVSPASMQSHLRLYEGYVQKYNHLAAALQSQRARGLETGIPLPDVEGLKTDLTYALSAIKNHELFFDCLMPSAADQPAGTLAEAIVKSFHSMPQYLMDLKQTAKAARGWAWTAYDLDQGFLFNYGSGSQDAMPVWNAAPLLAIDLYGHAYFYDYGHNKVAYVEAVMGAMNWETVAKRLEAITSKSR